MDTTVELDEAKLGAFGEKMLGILNSGMAANMISIGHWVGLFEAMAELGAPATSHEIASPDHRGSAIQDQTSSPVFLTVPGASAA